VSGVRMNFSSSEIAEYVESAFVPTHSVMSDE
jgi:hypothetical protein